MKRTELIPRPTVPLQECIIKFWRLLFDQVGQLRTNSYLQRRPGTGSCRVNRFAIEQRAVAPFQWAHLMRNRVEALRQAMHHAATSTITLRTHQWGIILDGLLGRNIGLFRSNCLQDISERRSGSWSFRDGGTETVISKCFHQLLLRDGSNSAKRKQNKNQKV